MKRLYCLLLPALFCTAPALAQTDSVDCTGKLFTVKTKVLNREKIRLILPGGKQGSFTAFWKDNYMQPYGLAGLTDLDGDGKKELVLSNFTGGAHCCDELYFFKNTGANQYTQTAKLFAGNTCYVDSLFLFDLHEAFGYFFTCYACGLQTVTKGNGLRDVSTVNLRYAAGKITVVAGTEALRQRIVNNLAYLKKMGWDGGVKEGDFDDGRRKELALNLAVSHFSFGQNLAATRGLFTANYPWKDADAVWKEFVVLLNNAKKNMSSEQ